MGNEACVVIEHFYRTFVTTIEDYWTAVVGVVGVFDDVFLEEGVVGVEGKVVDFLFEKGDFVVERFYEKNRREDEDCSD